MAYRQYIGARYVPLYAGRWDATRNYEPLTIVDDANGNSYTSKKDVPAGTALSNTEYWVQTSSFSGAIEQLRRDMTDAQSDIDNLETATGSLNSHVVIAEKNIEKLTDKMYIGGNYIFVSDSYANPEYGNFFAKLAEYLNIPSSNWFDAHASGGSFSDGAFLTNTRNVINNMTAEQKLKTYGVYVFAGINDAGKQFTTIDTQIQTYINYLKTELPNATIGIGYVGNIVEPGSNGREYRGRYTALTAYSNCSKYGAKFFKGMENILHDYSLMNADGIHPNADGAEALALYAANAIMGGQTDIVRYKRYATTQDINANFWTRAAEYFSPNISNVNLLPTPYESEVCAEVSQNNDVGRVEVRATIGITFTEPVTLRNGAQYQIGKIIEPLWRGASGQFTTQFRGYYSTSGNTYGHFDGMLFNFGGSLFIRIDQVSDSWAFSEQNVTSLLFHGFIIDVPTFVM